MLQIKHGYIEQLNILSTEARPVVLYSNCQKCYGKGYTGILTEKEYKKLLLSASVLRYSGHLPEGFDFGPHIQCHACKKIYIKHELDFITNKEEKDNDNQEHSDNHESKSKDLVREDEGRSCECGERTCGCEKDKKE
jgi:hypothetical protein